MRNVLIGNRAACAVVLALTMNLLTIIRSPVRCVNLMIGTSIEAQLDELMANGIAFDNIVANRDSTTGSAINHTITSGPRTALEDAVPPSATPVAATVSGAPTPAEPTTTATKAIETTSTTTTTSANKIQPPPSLDLPVSNTSSACLMWMDDSQRLVEWIAYHYFTFSLRTLVILRDPKSTQDLQPLIARWEGLMNITVWHHIDDFGRDAKNKAAILRWKDKLPGIAKPEEAANMAYKIHKANQREFYRGCSMHLQERNRTWSFFIDTDEIIVLNSNTVPNASERMAEPGSLFNALQQVQHHNITNGASHFERSCITTRRMQASSIESPDDHVRRGVPDFLDPYRLQTLRFRHLERKDYIGKAIADVSKFNFLGEQMSVHRYIVSQCPVPWGQREDIFHINHYIGTLEAFMRPGDNRGGLEDRAEKWRARSGKALERRGPLLGDEPRSWIQGFANHFGKESSVALLQDAGSPYNPETALKRMALPCKDSCVGPFHVRDSLIHKIEYNLQGAKQ